MAAKLSDQQWLDIRTKYELGNAIRSIAREYDIPHGTIQARIKKESWSQEMASKVSVIQQEISEISQMAKSGQLPIIQAKLTETVDLMGMFQSFVKLAANLNVQVLHELSTEPDLKTRIIGLNSLKATFKDIAEITKAPPVSTTHEDKDETIKIEFIRK